MAGGPATAGDLLADLVVPFADALRAAGMEVPVAATIDCAAALAALAAEGDAAGLYWAGRLTLVKRPEDLPLYDRVAASWPFGTGAALGPGHEVDLVGAMLVDGPAGTRDLADQEEVHRPTGVLRWSDREALRHRDFAACTLAELEESYRLIGELRVAGAPRRSARRRPARRGELDLRRTVRHALGNAGEPIRRAHRAPGHRPRRIVLLCDVSGSMEPYARALVRFAHAAVVGRRAVEVFALGTRLTRVTRELAARDPDLALAGAAGAVADWSGGTRLGDTLREFNDGWGVRGLARRADVVILSDGWDRGEPAVVGEQMARLRRVAHRVIWVNPLKAAPDYAPLARGMAAALPHVDEFVPGHSLAALEDLAALLRA